MYYNVVNGVEIYGVLNNSGVIAQLVVTLSVLTATALDTFLCKDLSQLEVMRAHQGCVKTKILY